MKSLKSLDLLREACNLIPINAAVIGGDIVNKLCPRTEGAAEVIFALGSRARRAGGVGSEIGQPAIHNHGAALLCVPCGIKGVGGMKEHGSAQRLKVVSVASRGAAVDEISRVDKVIPEFIVSLNAQVFGYTLTVSVSPRTQYSAGMMLKSSR